MPQSLGVSVEIPSKEIVRLVDFVKKNTFQFLQQVDAIPFKNKSLRLPRPPFLRVDIINFDGVFEVRQDIIIRPVLN